MQKSWFVVVLSGGLFGCTSLPQQAAAPVTAVEPPAAAACAGSTALPASLAGAFEPVDDASLLAKTLGKADQGALCQGQVYQSTASAKVVLYRAWNSTNPGSQFGNWWAFSRPEGAVAAYRTDYEICYQWSPLDMLVQCTLKPGTRVVVGTGQSAQCSQFLTYPVSAAQQVYVDQAQTVLADCATYVGEFSWR